MKIAIIGSRDFKDARFVFQKLSELLHYHATDKTTIISGGARGIDTLAEEFAKDNLVKTEIYEAEWGKYGKKAGFLRNQKIVDNAEWIIAFWDGTSKGTKHSIDLAIKAKKPINIYVRN